MKTHGYKISLDTYNCVRVNDIPVFICLDNNKAVAKMAHLENINEGKIVTIHRCKCATSCIDCDDYKKRMVLDVKDVKVLREKKNIIVPLEQSQRNNPFRIASNTIEIVQVKQ